MNVSSIIDALLCMFLVALPGIRGQKMSWADSYSVSDKCYCQTTYDHNIGDVKVDGPNGQITVREACELVGDGPEGDRVYYNDVQCGNGPPNDAGDEDECPGRVDLGDGNKDGCFEIGPTWSFPGEDKPPPSPPPPSLFAEEQASNGIHGNPGTF